MRFRRLQTRFLLAGCLLVATTVACGLWSALTFARLGTVVGRTLQQSEETIDLAAVLAGTLEREDDALLLALAGEEPQAGKDRAAQRQRFEEAYERLLPLLLDPEEKAAAADLRRHVEEYRTAGDALRATAGQPEAHRRYHERVNPVLRQAVGDCERLRDLNFRSMRRAGRRARDEANRATAIVVGISVAALLISTLVSVRLARAVLKPVHELTASVDAVRLGNFDRRVHLDSADELGRLADGFNRMAETLAEYRSSSLGELLEAKWTLEATLDALPDAVIVVEPDGRVVALNPPARGVLQAAGAEAVGRVEQLPLSPDHLAAVREALRGRSGVKSHTEFNRTLAFTLNGSKRQFLLTAVPVPQFAPKGSFGAVVVLDDVTDVARLDELRTELVGVASHELKTPLTTLRMNLLLLGEGADNLTPRQREILTAAAGGCEELAATIEELLDLTRIEAGQLRLAHDRVDLDAVIEHAVRALRPRFEDAEIALEVVRDSRPAIVRGDAARLGVVLANVLTNALKYTPRGGRVTVRVASGQNAGAGGKNLLQIAVTDTGPGVPAEFRERVFEKFFRVEHHRPGSGPDVRGTGIGLYLCREIIEAHGGSIRCEPGDDGRGTRIAMLVEAVA
jgi:NtrC-family two-component system sensor histidine kinase KinB